MKTKSRLEETVLGGTSGLFTRAVYLITPDLRGLHHSITGINFKLSTIIIIFYRTTIIFGQLATFRRIKGHKRL